MTDSVGKGVAAVGANSKALVEKTKINSAISSLESDKKHISLLLGQKVYELSKAGQDIAADDGVQNFISEIDRHVELINEKKEQITRIDEEIAMAAYGGARSSQSETKCKCGHVSFTGSKFCEECGSPMEAVEKVENKPDDAAGSFNAPNACRCGHTSAIDARFCEECGSPL